MRKPFFVASTVILGVLGVMLGFRGGIAIEQSNEAWRAGQPFVAQGIFGFGLFVFGALLAVATPAVALANGEV